MGPTIVDTVVCNLGDEKSMFILVPTPLDRPPEIPTVGVKVGTWVSLIDTVERACGFIRRQELLAAFERAQIAAECLVAMAHSFPDLAPLIVPDPLPFAQRLLGTLDEVRMHDLTSLTSELVSATQGNCDDATRVILFDRVRLVRELIERYELRLDEAGRADDVLRLKHVVGMVEDGWLRRPFDRLVVCDGSIRTPLQDKFVKAIERQGIDVIFWEGSGERSGEQTLLDAFAKGCESISPGANDDSIRVVRTRSAADELHAAAQLLLNEAARGTRFSDIAIVAPADESYLERLTQTLTRYNILHSVPLQCARFIDPVVQTFAAWLRVWAGSREVADIVSVLNDPGLRLGPVRTRLVRRFAEDRPIFAGHIEQLLEKPLSEQLDDAERESLQAVKKLLTAVQRPRASGEQGAALSSELTRLTLSSSSFSEAWTLFRETILSGRRAMAAARGEQHALKAAAALDAAVDSLLGSGSHQDGLVSVDGWLRRLASLMSGGVDVPYVRQGVAIHVYDVTLDLGRPELLVVLGFTRGRYPSRLSASPVFGYFERAALQRFGLISLEMPADRLRYEERQVRAWMGSARRLVCFVPERNAAGESTDPSLLYETIVAMIPQRERNAWRQRCDVYFGPEVVPQRQHSRFAFDYPSADGLLGAMRATRHSPTSLRELLECPYKFAANRILGLRDFGLAPINEIDARTQGEIVHGVIQRLFAGVSNRGGDPAAADLEPVLRSVAEERAPWVLSPHLRTRYLGLLRRVRMFVPRLFDLIAKLDLEVVGCEVSFGDEEPIKVTYGDLEFACRGRVDIVARRKSDGLRALIDVKFGKVEKYCEATRAGFDPQMAIYCRVHGAHGAFYYSIVDEREPLGAFATERFGPAEVPGHAQALRARLGEVEAALAGRLGRTLEAIENAGMFAPVDPAQYEAEMKPARVAPCEYCMNALLCRQPVGV